MTEILLSLFEQHFPSETQLSEQLETDSLNFYQVAENRIAISNQTTNITYLLPPLNLQTST